MEVSACGANRDEWLATWNISQQEADAAWAAKCALDEKVASQGNQIRQNSGIIPEIQPYRSQIDGSMIDSRTKHRNHLKRHDCIEVGNEKQKPRKPEPIKGLRDAIGKAVYQHLG